MKKTLKRLLIKYFSLYPKMGYITIAHLYLMRLDKCYLTLGQLVMFAAKCQPQEDLYGCLTQMVIILIFSQQDLEMHHYLRLTQPQVLSVVLRWDEII